MQLKLSNAELVCLRDVASATAATYGNMIAQLRQDIRHHYDALTITTPILASFENEINECQLSKAIWEEIWVHLQSRAFKLKPKYKVTITPAWAFAIRLQFNGVVERSTHSGNLLQRICDDIHQFYQ